ncbi:MAG TPA: TRAM domain-containing protein [Vicinamibacterales bacterium]|jgi:23S rRNA (uracil1939-C5)-methyltransferase|nr:TRAM domain-containing protein [Vicinamibacterales bacterium]
MLTSGQIITLDVERPVAGGRMLARHDGQVVLVAGTIPGERVTARVERVAKAVAHAETVEVLAASPDRRPAADWRCGGRDYAHVAYDRQRLLKAEILADAFRRLARLPLPSLPEVMASPETGYRLRARLHAAGGRLGFFREGSHALCDAEATGQLSAGTVAWIRRAESFLTAATTAAILGVEVAENIPESERTAHVEVRGPIDRAAWAPLADGLTGLTLQGESTDVVAVAGAPVVTDRLPVSAAADAPAVTLTRHTTAFFQANRFLLPWFVQHVVGLVGAGPVLDLYAGVGLFGLAAAAAGHGPVTLVEGDRTSGADLESNAGAYGGRVRVIRRSVEAVLGGRPDTAATCIVDPPRAGLSPEARAGLLRLSPSRVVYVSCDVATLARDARALVDGGYGLTSIRAVDLFPSTAHVETIALFDREVR